MNLTIPALKKGDLIEIVAPAKAIEEKYVLFAKARLEKEGFRVRISENCLSNYNYFSASINRRIEDFQSAIDDDEVKAIVCARGGYGCVQIVDKLQWANMLRNPKWIVGFSDVTVFHQRLNKIDLESIHGSMPLNFKENTAPAIDTLVQALKKEPYTISSPANELNKIGMAKGRLLGGNLSIIYSLLGTNDQPSYSDSILFIEEVGEHIYHIDRMFHALEKSGVLQKIKGLVVGGMTNIKDTEQSFGQSLEDMILSHFEYRNIPICFGFPAGHIDDNHALVLGRSVTLTVDTKGTSLTF